MAEREADNSVEIERKLANVLICIRSEALGCAGVLNNYMSPSAFVFKDRGYTPKFLAECIQKAVMFNNVMSGARGASSKKEISRDVEYLLRKEMMLIGRPRFGNYLGSMEYVN